MNKWFKANKVSLNTKKSLFFLYDKNIQINNLPLAFRILGIDGVEFKWEDSIKFLGVLLDENLTRKQNLKKH